MVLVLSRNNFLSVFVQMGANEASKNIDYPFRGVITFVVIDQSGNNRHINKSIRASGLNASFQEPTTKFNTENGVEQMISHQNLSNQSTTQTDPRFVEKDLLILGVAIRYNKNVE